MAFMAGHFTAMYTQEQDESIIDQITNNTVTGNKHAYYIFFLGSNLNSNQTISYPPIIEGVKSCGQYYILLNTLIPISLIVTLEFVKLLQAPFFHSDLEMYDAESDKNCLPISLTLHEELGAIDYIFADKTGTLTANIMTFKACSIGSVCYDEDYNEEDYEYIIQESCTSNRSNIH